MSSIIPAPATFGKQHPGVGLNGSVDRLLATALADLEHAVRTGRGDYTIHVVDHLARIARRQHGPHLTAATRTLALARGRISGRHDLTTPRRLAARIRIARRTTAGDPVTGEALRRVRTEAA
ncbi:hypothetical protein [Streptomyces sp. Z26]|uniref:hypothetical protein n=1 Tax=Streptomyces sp. Z26 TaxID=2500177 RepID=UPI000EF15C79|nr:hypothetical protein [Streptomyces sp. Z26]RLL68397.1 hypothetical protein D7M15_17920 [Streptomyces sp. Z26]